MSDDQPNDNLTTPSWDAGHPLTGISSISVRSEASPHSRPRSSRTPSPVKHDHGRQGRQRAGSCIRQVERVVHRQQAQTTPVCQCVLCWWCSTRSAPLAFVLHDIFGVPFDHIGHILGRNPNTPARLATQAQRVPRDQGPLRLPSSGPPRWPPSVACPRAGNDDCVHPTDRPASPWPWSLHEGQCAGRSRRGEGVDQPGGGGAGHAGHYGEGHPTRADDATNHGPGNLQVGRWPAWRKLVAPTRGGRPLQRSGRPPC